MNRRTTCGVLAFVLASASLYGADSSHLGTWKQNLAKSTMSPGPKPTTPATLRIEAAGTAEKITVEGATVDGKPSNFVLTLNPDGKPSPVTSPYGDMASVKKIDARTDELTYTAKGKVTRTVKRTMSADGKSMTLVSTGVNAKGEPYNATAVYEKQ